MIITYLIAMFIIFGLLAGWIGVQHLSRKFSARHPELGPAPEDGAGCGMFCFCKNVMNCPHKKRALSKSKSPVESETL